MEKLCIEVDMVRSGAAVETVHFCKDCNKHLWIVRVREINGSFIVWTWNVQSSGLCHGVYDCDEESSWREFAGKVKLYG